MMKRTTRYLSSAGVMAGSIFLVGDTLRLVAKWGLDAMDGIFLLHTGLLAAVIFAFRAKEAGDSWPLSIRDTGQTEASSPTVAAQQPLDATGLRARASGRI